MSANGLTERIEQRRHMADPAGHRRTIDVHPAAGVDIRLAVQRLVVAELRHEHVSQKRRPRPSSLDRQRRHRRLDDRLAGPAAHFGADMKHALEVGRNIFKHLAFVRADLAELLAAAGRTDAVWLVGNQFLRQMIGQGRAARRLAIPLWRRGSKRLVLFCCFGSRFAFGFALFDIANEQFELLDRLIEPFGRAPEPSSPQHGELHLQLLDQQRLGVNLGGKCGDIALQIACDAAQIIGIAG